jgi:hypothetical protein
MLSSRRTCPFGLPDEAEDIENLVLVAVGHVFRATTAPMLDGPLPAELAGLLRQIDRQERNVQARRSATLQHRRRATLHEPVAHSTSRVQAPDRRADASVAMKGQSAL